MHIDRQTLRDLDIYTLQPGKHHSFDGSIRQTDGGHGLSNSVTLAAVDVNAS
jgi:hypothetical protein